MIKHMMMRNSCGIRHLDPLSTGYIGYIGTSQEIWEAIANGCGDPLHTWFKDSVIPRRYLKIVAKVFKISINEARDMFQEEDEEQESNV
jgi:hypothetical protein